MIDPRAAAIVDRLRSKGPSRFSSLLYVVQNARTLNSKLKIMIGLGWVEKYEGSYRLTPRGERAADLLRQLESLLVRPPAVDVERVPHPYFGPVLKALAEKLLERFGENLLGILLFGSVARGDWTRDSDIDLLVLFREYPAGREGVVSELLSVRKEIRKTGEYQRAFRAGFVPTVEFYPLSLEDSSRFRRLYLEAFTEGIVIMDREGDLADLIRRFQERMKEAGAKRVETPGRGHYWILEERSVLEGSL
ncbi:MAG: nucleotidyltransferase domain-containing protein [Thermoplasmata archaeon]